MFAPFTRSYIEKYSFDVLRNIIGCGLPSCPICNTQPAFFRRHQARPRKFRILCDALVQVVKCLVIRWKCPGCNKTFTQQPPFGLPHKRYTSDTILDRSGWYLEDKTATYRKTVLEKGIEIFHASTDKGNTPVDKVLSHTTPYRWISTLGGFKEIPRRALDILLQKDPTTKVCRDLAALRISPDKFVKVAREGTLKRSRRLIHLEAVFRVVFHASIFPFFATGCAWR
ncbi:MAG: hypothetical protein ACP5O1_11795 [Phycisphaerae bacterium]